MTLSHSFQVGGLRCHLLEGGLQRLDGGAMFGVVPYTLWSRRVPHDERHRIPLAMRCLLVEHPDGPVLIDTAPRQQGGRGSSSTSTGSRTTDWRAPPSWRTRSRWPGSCRATCAGSSTLTSTSTTRAATPRSTRSWRTTRRRHVRPSFPNATYVVQKGELEFARKRQRADPGQLPAAQLRADRRGEPVATAGGRR